MGHMFDKIIFALGYRFEDSRSRVPKPWAEA